MKGPGYKLSHDVRRTWKCPVCGSERKVAGDITSLVCNCRHEGTFMKIVVERIVAPRPFQVIRDHDVRSSEFGIDDLPVLQPHPSSLPPERSSPRRPRPGSSEESPDASARPEAAPEKANQIDHSTPPPTCDSKPNLAPPSEPAGHQVEDDWGEGIL